MWTWCAVVHCDEEYDLFLEKKLMSNPCFTQF